ncbi:carbon monoxide dehydrogenase subunit G [Burkholderia sp. Bp9142]|uniref:SRPBCC family protein n=1 Tax=Burkholderia sp. Bp9142 TaxID=2184573 RepID=UPI000F5AFC94|nr:carbon monoxide dehydrogenase subunit G [Burkholderia sp. Bp9142]RQR24601.1 carbon monoxide dehydrogenase [Burkholderia sp. Bp9142]
MDMTGEVRIPASRDVVWAALNSPATLKACIPGCEELSEQSENEMVAVVAIKIGPVSARFNCAVTLSELDPPNSYRITGEGQGGVAGHARGGAIVKLTADGAETLLSYTFSAQVGGKLAQLGSRMIDATTKTLSAVFFKNLAREIEAQTQADLTKPQEEPITPEDAGRAKPLPAPARQTLSSPAPSVVAGPSRADRRIATTALAIAVVAVLLAGLALNELGSARGALPVAYASTEFNIAVQLLTVLAVGYLLGRSSRNASSG